MLSSASMNSQKKDGVMMVKLMNKVLTMLESLNFNSKLKKVLTVNKALKQLDLGEYELVKAKDYFYFDSTGTSSWTSNSVFVYSI